MTEHPEQLLWPVPTTAAIAAAILALAVGGAPMAGGVLAGGLWNVANLWCLMRLLSTWLTPQPSTRRVLAWAAIKFPLLYLIAVAIFRYLSVSLVGFGIGFTVVLGSAVAVLAIHARQLVRPIAHGR